MSPCKGSISILVQGWSSVEGDSPASPMDDQVTGDVHRLYMDDHVITVALDTGMGAIYTYILGMGHTWTSTIVHGCHGIDDTTL